MFVMNLFNVMIYFCCILMAFPMINKQL